MWNRNHAIRCAVLALASAAAQAQVMNPALWSGLKYRMIGPSAAAASLRVTGVPTQPNTFYMGSTGGGVWKTHRRGPTLGQHLRWPDPARVDGRGGGLCIPIPT